MDDIKKLKEILGIPDEIRIGQHIWNQMNHWGKWESPEANQLFFIDDESFIKIIKQK